MENLDIRIVNKQLWSEITVGSLYNIKSILDSTQVLLDSNIDENKEMLIDHPYVAAGLYTFAIEEFGKYLYLKSIKPINDEYPIEYFKEFRKHTKKFKRALDFLPEECSLVHKGGFGKNFGVGFDINEIADFETRKNIFYSDFKNSAVPHLPVVDAKSLENSVRTLFEITKSELENFNNDHFKR